MGNHLRFRIAVPCANPSDVLTAVLHVDRVRLAETRQVEDPRLEDFAIRWRVSSAAFPIKPSPRGTLAGHQ